MWTHRIILEAAQYESNAFATLTYENTPLTLAGLPTLAPEHLRNFLKRLRKTLAPNKIRFYAVGEYGENTERPHYHAALFNFPTCERGRTLRRLGSSRPLWRSCCSACNMVGTAWSHGDVDLGMLETSSAQYVAGYVTKKLTHRSDPRLNGREPEFARMSNRPGIAYDALHEIASTWLTLNLDTREADVPVTLRHGSRHLPLGRYLRRKLRLLIGKDEKTPQAILELAQKEVRDLQETIFSAPGPPKKISTKETLIKNSKGEHANFYSKQQFSKRKAHL